MEVQAQGRGTLFLGTNDVYTSFTIARIDYSVVSDYSQRIDQWIRALFSKCGALTEL